MFVPLIPPQFFHIPFLLYKKPNTDLFIHLINLLRITRDHLNASIIVIYCRSTFASHQKVQIFHPIKETEAPRKHVPQVSNNFVLIRISINSLHIRSSVVTLFSQKIKRLFISIESFKLSCGKKSNWKYTAISPPSYLKTTLRYYFWQIKMIIEEVFKMCSEQILVKYTQRKIRNLVLSPDPIWCESIFFKIKNVHFRHVWQVFLPEKYFYGIKLQVHWCTLWMWLFKTVCIWEWLALKFNLDTQSFFKASFFDKTDCCIFAFVRLQIMWYQR